MILQQYKTLYPYCRTLVDDSRLEVILHHVSQVKGLRGDMAEIGVYKGGVSHMIAAAERYKRLYVCDSFEGLPEPTSEDNHHRKGDFADNSLKDVVEYLDFPNTHVIKGFFPNSSIHAAMYHSKFSFVHLDVDLYKPTLECLEFFYPRMVKGGVIISDDYKWKDCEGVKKAFDKFMTGKSEKLIDTGVLSCILVKE